MTVDTIVEKTLYPSVLLLNKRIRASFAMKHETFFSILFMRLKFIEKKGLFRHTPTLFHFSEFFRKKRRLYVGRASPAVSLSVKEKFSEPLNQLQIDRWVECLIEKVLFFVKTNGKFLYQTREQPSSSFDLPPPFYQESCTLWSS